MFSSTAQAEVGKQSHSVLHSKFWPAWARDPVFKNNVFYIYQNGYIRIF